MARSRQQRARVYGEPMLLTSELTTLLDGMEEGAVVIDQTCHTVFANAAAARIFGVPSPEALLAVSFAELLRRFRVMDRNGEPLLAEWAPTTLALQGQRPPPAEVRWRVATTGTEYRGTLTATPLTDAEGRVRHVVTVFRDGRPARTLHLLSEASAALSGSLDERDGLQALARFIVPELADGAGVELFDDAGDLEPVALVYAEPAAEAVARELRKRYPPREGVPGNPWLALRSGQPDLAPQIQDEQLRSAALDEEHRRLLAALRPRAILSVPLMARGRTLGALTLVSTRSDRGFDDATVSLAVELARRAAIAVDHARVYREAREALRRKDEEARVSETLRRLGASFASELDPERLVQQIIDEATRFTGARFGVFFYELIGERRELQQRYAVSGISREVFANLPLPSPTELLAPAFGPGGVVRCDDVLAEPRYGRTAPHHGVPEGHPRMRSLLAVAVTSRSGRLLGRLLFGHGEPGVFTAEHERIIASIATQAAVALENARLFRQLRNVEEKVRRSEERLRLALAAGRMGYFDWDLVSGELMLSPRFEAMLGMTPGSHDGTFESLQQAIHPDDRETVTRRFERVIHQDIERDSFGYRVALPGGVVRWVECHSRLVRDGAGRPSRLIGIGLDVTARYEAEERSRRLVDDLVRSNTELEQFAYVASHDLREPLRMVASYTRLLARRYAGRLDEDADTFIRYAVDGAARMQRLIDDLLTYSRVGTRAKELAPVSCQEILGRALTNLQTALEESGGKVTSDALPMVLGDEVQLEQLFQNLVGNAIKFRSSDRPPRIHVGAERRGDQWLLSVRDNGIGIDPQYFQRIFVIFQRLHTNAEYTGTGIGLAICKKIVDRHGGRIHVESTPGQGATFYLTLPATGAHAAPAKRG